MSEELDGVKTSLSNLETSEGGFLANAQRVLTDLVAANTKATSGEDITAEAADIQKRLDAMTAAISSANAALDAGDPVVDATAPAAPVDPTATPSA